MPRKLLRCIAAAIMLSAACTVTAQDQGQDRVSDSDVADQRQAQIEADDQAWEDRNCLRETGSLIKPRAGSASAQQHAAQQHAGQKPASRAHAADSRRCISAPGRSYSQEDLRRTGHMNMADALRALDPSIR